MAGKTDLDIVHGFLHPGGWLLQYQLSAKWLNIHALLGEQWMTEWVSVGDAKINFFCWQWHKPCTYCFCTITAVWRELLHLCAMIFSVVEAGRPIRQSSELRLTPCSARGGGKAKGRPTLQKSAFWENIFIFCFNVELLCLRQIFASKGQNIKLGFG